MTAAFDLRLNCLVWSGLCLCLCLQGVTQLCSLLRYTTSLTTLRVDVASREGAEMIARDLPHNRSLMHITLGGPVPEALLAQMSETLAANTVRQLTGSPGRGGVAEDACPFVVTGLRFG